MTGSNLDQAIGGRIFRDNKDASKYRCRSPGLVWLATQHHFHPRLCFHRDFMSIRTKRSLVDSLSMRWKVQMVGGDRNEDCYVPVPYPNGECGV